MLEHFRVLFCPVLLDIGSGSTLNEPVVFKKPCPVFSVEKNKRVPEAKRTMECNSAMSPKKVQEQATSRVYFINRREKVNKRRPR